MLVSWTFPTVFLFVLPSGWGAKSNRQVFYDNVIIRFASKLVFVEIKRRNVPIIRTYKKLPPSYVWR